MSAYGGYAKRCRIIFDSRRTRDEPASSVDTALRAHQYATLEERNLAQHAMARGSRMAQQIDGYGKRRGRVQVNLAQPIADLFACDRFDVIADVILRVDVRQARLMGSTS